MFLWKITHFGAFYSELKTGKNDKLQISANRGRITKLTWNSLGTLY